MFSSTHEYNRFKNTRNIILIGSFFLILIGYLLISYLSIFSHVTDKSNKFFTNLIEINSPSRVLVVYVYGKTHAMSEKNLVFFIRTAVRQTHNADYYFILQQINNIPINETLLPILPTNAHYIQHENKCYDIGTIGWFLSLGTVDKNKYKYFIFLNSSIRGPFIVSYYDSSIWYTIFIRRLNNYIKLVGCTINCEIAPHVQSYLWALDLQGLNLLLNTNTTFTCYESKTSVIHKAEVGASQIILESGFGIDSLMKKYQNIDFRQNKTKKCTIVKNPTLNRNVDGIPLDPFEVVFVKIKDTMGEYRERVPAYEKWIHQ